MMISPNLNWRTSVTVSWISQRRTLAFPSPVSSVPQMCSRIAAPFCQADALKPPSSTSMESLKGQLEALHLEAEQARARANAARARFLRLTETIENLTMRAIVDLKSGKEESARYLVAEKQKVMQALEKSKQRAELHEELCNKLGEAISSKEVQLIAALSSATVGVDESNKTTANVRIVSPKADDLASKQSGEVREREDSAGNQRLNDQDAKASTAEKDAVNMVQSSNDTVNAVLSTRPEMYSEFLSKIDNHLHNAEIGLHGFLSIAGMLLPDDVGMKTNEKVITVRQIWHDVLTLRARIGEAVQQEDFG